MNKAIIKEQVDCDIPEKCYQHVQTGAIASYTKGAGYYVTLDNFSHGYMAKCFIENTKDWKPIMILPKYEDEK